jgi:hypothetical protein
MLVLPKRLWELLICLILWHEFVLSLAYPGLGLQIFDIFVKKIIFHICLCLQFSLELQSTGLHLQRLRYTVM